MFVVILSRIELKVPVSSCLLLSQEASRDWQFRNMILLAQHTFVYFRGREQLFYEAFQKRPRIVGGTISALLVAHALETLRESVIAILTVLFLLKEARPTEAGSSRQSAESLTSHAG